MPLNSAEETYNSLKIIAGPYSQNSTSPPAETSQMISDVFENNSREEQLSVQDSGYGTRQSFDITEAGTVDERISPRPLKRIGSLQIPGHSNLFSFEPPPDFNVQNRFKEVLPVIENSVLSILPAASGCLGIRTMFLGTSEADVAAYIVIFCRKDYLKRIESRVNTPALKSLYEAPGSPPVKILVVGHEPRLTATKFNVEVCGNQSTTLCGTPICVTCKAQEGIQAQKATIGGVIKVTHVDRSVLYGITAGHVLDHGYETSREVDENYTSNTPPSRESAQAKDKYSHEFGLGLEEPSYEACFSAGDDQFAKILEPWKSNVKQAKRPSLDWAILSLKVPLPNECIFKYHDRTERRELKEAARPTFQDGASEPVIMMGGTEGSGRGELSSMISRILTSSSDNFVDAYILTLNDQNAIQEGDSGSWIVHSGSPLVFGHVVAMDVFGDAYVIPMLDMFEDIKQCLGATSVELPTAQDFQLSQIDHGSMADVSEVGALPVADLKYNSIGRSLQAETHKEKSPEYSRPENISVMNHKPQSNVPGHKLPVPPVEVPTLMSLQRGCSADDIDSFFDDEESPWRGELVRRYFKQRSTEASQHIANYKRDIWFDDRSIIDNHNSVVGEYNNPLTATGLKKALEEKNNREFSNRRNRTLIYTTDPSPECIRALFQTAPMSITEALRSAITGYLAYQASILIRPYSSNCSASQLSLHLPFFQLRRVPRVESDKTYQNPLRRRIDVSYLNLDNPQSAAEGLTMTWHICEVNLSCVVAETYENSWIGYVFADSEIQGRMDVLPDVDENLDVDVLPMGPIAKHPASPPSFDPKVYWMHCFAIWSRKAEREWRHIIFQFKDAINHHKFGPVVRHVHKTKINPYLKEDVDFTGRALSILRHVDGTLSDTLNAWKNFSSEEGNVAYITEKGQNGFCLRNIDEIKRTFKALEDQQRTLQQLERSCSEYMKTLELQLLCHTKEVSDNQEKSGDFSIMVGLPLVLTTTFFSMEATTIPFQPTPLNFFITLVLLVVGVSLTRIVLSRISKSDSRLERLDLKNSFQAVQKRWSLSRRRSIEEREYLD